MSWSRFSALAPIGALALALASPAARAADGPFWPSGEPASHARAFFEAFGRDSAAMRAFWTAHGSKQALAERPVEARLEIWRDMRQRHGALTPLEARDARADYVQVRARDGRGELVDIGFACEGAPPHGLVALQLEELGAGAGPRAAEADGPPPTEAAVKAALLASADSLSRAGAFAGVVLLDRDGTTLASGAWGPASRDPARANTLETQFNLGSINKIFTHVAILQLASRGALALDRPVTRYLPDYRVEGADRMTIRMLLEHRGGVPDVLESEALWKDPGAVRGTADWYALVRTQPLEFAPGERQKYSNGGFVLLGAVIERVSGESYYDYVAKHVYAPAGMTATGHFPRAERRPNRAVSYTFERAQADGAAPGPGPWPCSDHGLGLGSPAGGGYSTAADLVRFARALRAHTLLDADRTRELIGEPARLGIAGGSPGVNAALVLAGPYTLVVLANLDPPAAERVAGPTARQLRRLTGEPAAPRTVGHGE